MRHALSFTVKIVVSAGLLYLAVEWTSVSHLGERLSQAKIEWLALMVMAQTAQTALSAIRWRYIVLLCGHKLPPERAIQLSFVAAFFNQTLPSSIGGDAVRIWMLAKRGVGWSDATYSVIIDRLVALVVLSVIVIACLPWTLVLISDPIGRTALLLIGFGSLVAVLAFVALGLINPNILRSWLVTRHLVKAAAVAARLAGSRISNLVILLSLSIHLLTALAAWCAAQAIAAPFDFLISVFLVLPVVLVTAVPISIAGWGVRESAMTVAFGYAGLAQSDGLLISLLFGGGLFVVGMFGGVIWIVSANRTTISTKAKAAQHDQ